MRKIIALVIAPLFCMAAAFAGCGGNRQSYARYFYDIMGATAILTITCDQSELDKFEQTCGDISRLLENIDDSLSLTKQNSYISKFNSAAAGEQIEIDEITYRVLQTAADMFDLTGGKYNPAVYYSVQAYGFGKGNAEPQDLPDGQVLAAYRELSESFENLTLTELNGTYYAGKPQKTVIADGEELSLKLDLSGLGKGYACDLVYGILKDAGFEYGNFNFDNSSIVLLKSAKAVGGNYKLGLTNPRYESGGANDYARLELCDSLVSTSGDYVQYYERNGARYCHIIDPFTGAPVQTGFMSVTVAGGSAAENDAITTAVMAMDFESAVRFINDKLADKPVVAAYGGGDGYKILTNADGLIVTDERFELL